MTQLVRDHALSSSRRAAGTGGGDMLLPHPWPQRQDLPRERGML
ncbi:hypothetical protein [Microvirga pakistanensis]|nr:hypothetical protein [Microvirga pakistanensis]